MVQTISEDPQHLHLCLLFSPQCHSWHFHHMFHFLFAYASSPLSCSLLLWTVGPNSWTPPPPLHDLSSLSEHADVQKQNHERKSDPFVFIVLFINMKIWWHVLRIKEVDYGCSSITYLSSLIRFWFDYHQLGSQPVNGTQLYFNSRKRYLVDLYYFSLLFVWAALSSWAVLVFWGILLHKGYQLLEVTEGKKNSVIQIKSSQNNNCSQQEKVYF